MSAAVKERTSKQMYRQCVLHGQLPANGCREYVAWIPAELARVGKHVTIDAFPGVRWKVISAGDPKPEHLVDWYAEHGRNGLPDGTGPSTPMRRSPPKKTKSKKGKK